MKKKSAIIRIAVLGVLIVLGLVFSFTSFDIGLKTYNSFASSIKLGLDLKGGVYAVYQATNTDTDDFDSKMNGTRASLEALIINKGYGEATVVREGSDRLRVEVPDIDDPQQIFSIIGEPAQIEFILVSTNEIVITGQNVTNASGSYSPSSGYVVELRLDSEGTKRFSDATSNVGDSIKIDVIINEERRTLSTPNINSQISDGQAIITGFPSQEAAQELADQIMSGTFDVKLEVLQIELISATLGENALRYGLIAGIIGFILILAFMGWFYRGFGLIAGISLLLYVPLFLFFLAVLPWVQLTLPGIAGILLSIGMAVDANIVIYERIKDEYRNGKSITASSYAGFKRATVAIMDSNITTIIVTILLLLLGTGSIKGFALTLLIGIVLSMFTSLFVTRKLVKYFLAINNKNGKFYGLKRGKGFEDINADETDVAVERQMNEDLKQKNDKKAQRKQKNKELSGGLADEKN